MVVVFLINKNCFLGDKYYRGAYSKPHRQSQEAKAAFDRNDTTYIDWEQRLQIGRGQQHTIGIHYLYEWAGVGGRLRDFRCKGSAQGSQRALPTGDHRWGQNSQGRHGHMVPTGGLKPSSV